MRGGLSRHGMSAPRFDKGCVVGLGVVGIPVAAKLAEAGIPTVGLDVDKERVAAIASGRYPFESEEPGMAELLAKVHGSGTLTATTDPAEAIQGADVVIVVVQTPVDDEGIPRYAALKAALASIAPHLQKGTLIVVESTIAPGTMRNIVVPALEQGSGLKAGPDLHVGHCPERVMPGKLLHNITHYDRVVGGIDPAATERMLQLYRLFVTGELSPTDMTTAEVVKTTENAYRDVQIAFANEVARICQVVGADAWEVRKHVNRVEDRNMHMPGTGVGGHCIPKDGLLLAYGAGGRFEPLLLHTARRVNEQMPQAAAELVAEALAQHTNTGTQGVLKGRTVVVLGASYLPGSDDLRDTPAGPLATALETLGATVVITDPYVERMPERAVERDLETALKGADAIIISTAHKQYLSPPWPRWAELVATRVAVDGRGVWDPAAARDAGFTYRGIGR